MIFDSPSVNCSRTPGSLSSPLLWLPQLIKNPGFTAVAMLGLAICIGGSLPIFAVVDSTCSGAGIERGNSSHHELLRTGIY